MADENSLSICLPWVESQNQESDSKNEILCEVWNIPVVKYSALSLLIIPLSLSLFASVFCLTLYLPLHRLCSLPSQFLFVSVWLWDQPGHRCHRDIEEDGVKTQEWTDWHTMDATSLARPSALRVGVVSLSCHFKSFYSCILWTFLWCLWMFCILFLIVLSHCSDLHLFVVNLFPLFVSIFICRCFENLCHHFVCDCCHFASFCSHYISL